MPAVINIFNVKINNVSTGASVNYGTNFVYKNNVQSKTIGTSIINGDASLQNNANRNQQNDPDLLDLPNTPVL